MTLKIDYTKDELFDSYALSIMRDRYMLPEENSPQDALARAAKTFGTNEAHAQRLYDYASQHWFMFATPILANAGTKKGLPVSCFLSMVNDDIESLSDNLQENIYLSINGGGIGCVDAETEYLTPSGWKYISDYTEGDKVCTVVHGTEKAYFKKPEAYINGPADKLYKLYNSTKSIVVSANHRNYYTSDNVNRHIKTTEEILSFVPTTVRFLGNIHITGTQGLPYTPQELRFFVALAADGFQMPHGDAIRFAFTRHRKIQRLTDLLESLGIDYTLSKDKEATVFIIKDYGVIKKPLTFEHFGDATYEQLAVIVDELGFWDGSFDHRTSNLCFSTMKTQEADFVQYAMFNAKKTRISIGEKSRDKELVVRETSSGASTFSGHEEFVPVDGKQYCFTTDTGLWLARRGNFVFITGNSSWSAVRSMGQKTKHGVEAPGIIPFMKVVDSQMLAYYQGGTRRGSAATYLDIDHPEIISFLEMRKPTGGDHNRKCLNLHHAVNISNKFMQLLEDCIADKEKDDTWELIDPHSKEVVGTVSAKYLWQTILQLRMETGEPYIHYIDHSNDARPEVHKALGLTINNSNLCAEVILPTTKDRTAVCVLSSLNLEYYDQWKNTNIVADMVEMLDNVITYFCDNAPKEMWRAVNSAKQERSLGLGAMGLHAYLQKHNVAWESDEATEINLSIFEDIRTKAEKHSIQLGKDRGVAPDFLSIPAVLSSKEQGRRNVYLCAIAPNASTSILCGNTSPGIEPFRANAYRQETHNGTHLKKNKYLEDVMFHLGMDEDERKSMWKKIVANGGSIQKFRAFPKEVKEVFKTAIEIDQKVLVEHAALRYNFIDQAQSLNLFFHADASKKYIHDVHFLAWKLGVKTLYYCRSQVVNRAEDINERFDRQEINVAPARNTEISCVGCED